LLGDTTFNVKIDDGSSNLVNVKGKHTYRIVETDSSIKSDQSDRNYTIVFKPDGMFIKGVRYNISIDGLADLSGNAIQKYQWFFRTGSAVTNIEIPRNINHGAATFGDIDGDGTLRFGRVLRNNLGRFLADMFSEGQSMEGICDNGINEPMA